MSNSLFQANSANKQSSVLMMVETQPSFIDNCDFIYNSNQAYEDGTGLFNLITTTSL